MFACAYLAQGNLEEAKKYISAILFKTPEELFSHKKLGIIYFKENNFSSAISEFSLVKNLAPSNVETALLLALSHAQDNNPAKRWNY